jgi:branched-chain amino acid transport system substrate-binding protein
MRTGSRRFRQVAAAVGGVLLLAGSGRAAAQEKELVVGALIPMTGQGASYGTLMSRGADLAVDELNKAGGVAGYKLSMKYEDHQAKPDVAVLAFNSLARRYGPPAVLSSYTSITLAVAPIAARTGMVVLNAGGQGDVLAGASPALFNVISLNGLEAEVLARYLAGKRGFRSAGVLYANDEGGRSALNAFKKFFEQAGGKVTVAEASQLGAADFRNQLTKIKSAQPAVLVLATYGKDTAIIAKQARELDLGVPVAQNSWSLLPEVFAEPASEGMIVTSIAVKPSPAFADEYRRRYGAEVQSVYPITFYNAVKVVAQAAKYAVDHGQKVTGETLRDAILKIRRFEGAAGAFVFRDDGTITAPVNVGVIEKGKERVIETLAPEK